MPIIYKASSSDVDLAIGPGTIRQVMSRYGTYTYASNFPYHGWHDGVLHAYGLWAYQGKIYNAYPLDWPALYVSDDRAWIEERGDIETAWHRARLAVGTGPMLVRAGEPTDIDAEVEKRGANTGLRPWSPTTRTAVGVSKDGQAVFAGVWSLARLHDVAKDLRRAGAYDAIAADGGRSTVGLTPQEQLFGEKAGQQPYFLVFKEAVEYQESRKKEKSTGGENMASLSIQQDFIPKGRNNRPGFAMTPEYLTIHDTANPGRGANALAHARYLKGDNAANIPVSWHFTVDDTNIVQHLPLNESGWHAGDGRNGPGNRKSIGIELCENSDGDRHKTVVLAARLTAHLQKKLGIPRENIVQHHKWSGKNCPRLLRPEWDQWLELVDTFAVVEGHGMSGPYKDVSRDRWSRQDIEWAADKGLIRGFPDGTYQPSEPVTREQMAVILHRLWKAIHEKP